ncbi:MAG: leucyl/phenylalanyl-tRNA--protein transferase [Flavobacteriales bacterium]
MNAYWHGRFPMCHEDGELYWHDPDPRAIFPLADLRPNARSLRAFRQAGFRTTIDQAFGRVVRGCADRDTTWIDRRIIDSYIALHAQGYAHSVETWVDGELVGGIYGVSLRGAFFGESMFSRVPNAGKAAFYGLVAHLLHQGHVLFDTQYVNDFTRQLGAVEIPRDQFRERLDAALEAEVRF